MLSEVLNCIKLSAIVELPTNEFLCVPSEIEEAMMLKSSKRTNQFMYTMIIKFNWNSQYTGLGT